jgi:thiosulfate/3-mercaptopyruvate sulfurtransferase
MLPEPAHFAREAGRLGIDNDTRVIVYDSAGLFSAARVWWMFRAFGHDRVAVLDGGLPAWRRLGLPVESGVVERPSAAFVARFDPSSVWTRADVARNLESRTASLIDARPPGRFAGTDPEPRPGLPSGHIPGARNIPFTAVIDPDTGCVRPEAELRARFAGLDEHPVVCSCGTGVTACVLAFALHRLGREEVAVYDGSWTEWAGRDDAPIETGPGPNA